MKDRYYKTFSSKYVYYVVEVITIVTISIVNLWDWEILNLAVWFAAIAFISYVFFFDDSQYALRRVVECEVLLFYIGVCEALGVYLISWVMRWFQIELKVGTMRGLEITFSKVVVIFMYYMVFVRLMGKKKAPFTKVQWMVNFIMLVYSLINMLVIADGAQRGQADFMLTVNMGCVVLADLYLLYFMKLTNEKSQLEREVEILEKQADMQYRYYLSQEQKYNMTVHILHDVDKHIKSIEALYAHGRNGGAAAYAKEIRGMLEPLIPVKYTGNPILDILLTDKAMIMREKQIKLEMKVDNVNLGFLEAIDATTIFGNLIDNAIEAVERGKGERWVRISILPYQEMILIRIENNALPLKWRNGMPISEKGKNHGIGLANVKRSIEKYDGDIAFKQENGIVTVDLLLNS